MGWIPKHLKTLYLKGKEVIRAKYKCSHLKKKGKELQKVSMTSILGLNPSQSSLWLQLWQSASSNVLWSLYDW